MKKNIKTAYLFIYLLDNLLLLKIQLAQKWLLKRRLLNIFFL